MKRLVLLVLAIVFVPTMALAGAQLSDWYGTYSMNSDGKKGTLIISGSKIDCITTPWCDMVLRFKDSRGNARTGKIETIIGNGQHMVFHINYPTDRVKYDAYLFGWDKTKMAGTSLWRGKTFGFYAIRK